jgi:hypothetical protein
MKGLTLLLAFATALASFATGWLAGSPAIANPVASGTKEDVRAFYNAVNETVRSGDVSGLDAIVSKNLTIHGPLASLAPDREGLTHYLLSLHAIAPDLTVTPGSVALSGDRAVADVKMTSSVEGSFLGSALSGLSPWGTVDAFTIGNHRVLEFWSGVSGPALLEPLTTIPVTIYPPAERIVTLDRLTIAPDETFQASGEEPLRWLYGETSRVSVTSELKREDMVGEVWQDAPPPDQSRTSLGPGDLLTLPPSSETEISNTGGIPASLLVLTVAPPAVTDRTAGSVDRYGHWTAGSQSAEFGWSTGASRVAIGGTEIATITGNVKTELPRDAATLAIGRATLAPGAMLTGLKAQGPRFFIVNAGTIDLFSEGEAAMIYRGTGSYRHEGSLDQATGALLPLGGVATLHNRGTEPATATIFAILPGY